MKETILILVPLEANVGLQSSVVECSGYGFVVVVGYIVEEVNAVRLGSSICVVLVQKSQISTRKKSSTLDSSCRILQRIPNMDFTLHLFNIQIIHELKEW